MRSIHCRAFFFLFLICIPGLLCCSTLPEGLCCILEHHFIMPHPALLYSTFSFQELKIYTCLGNRRQFSAELQFIPKPPQNMNFEQRLLCRKFSIVFKVENCVESWKMNRTQMERSALKNECTKRVSWAFRLMGLWRNLLNKQNVYYMCFGSNGVSFFYLNMNDYLLVSHHMLQMECSYKTINHWKVL